MCSLDYNDHLQCQLLTMGKSVSRSTGLVPRRTEKILGTGEGKWFWMSLAIKKIFVENLAISPLLREHWSCDLCWNCFSSFAKSLDWNIHTHISTECSNWHMLFHFQGKKEPTLWGTLQWKHVVNHNSLFCCNISFLQTNNFCFPWMHLSPLT